MLRDLIQSGTSCRTSPIVDDEEPVRKALKRLLRASGLEAESYASGKDFLEASALREPDCVVLDLHMPVMSGLQVLRALQAARRMLPIVIITAHDAPEAREQCLAAGRRGLPAQAARRARAARHHFRCGQCGSP